MRTEQCQHQWKNGTWRLARKHESFFPRRISRIRCWCGSISRRATTSTKRPARGKHESSVSFVKPFRIGPRQSTGRMDYDGSDGQSLRPPFRLFCEIFSAKKTFLNAERGQLLASLPRRTPAVRANRKERKDAVNASHALPSLELVRRLSVRFSRASYRVFGRDCSPRAGLSHRFARRFSPRVRRTDSETCTWKAFLFLAGRSIV